MSYYRSIINATNLENQLPTSQNNTHEVHTLHAIVRDQSTLLHLCDAYDYFKNA